MEDIDQNIDNLEQKGTEILPEDQKIETIYERLVDYGMLQYTPAQIARCEGMKKIDVEILLARDQEAKMIYEKAYANAQFELDAKIMNLAMSGDVKAIAMHQDRLARAMMEGECED